MAYLTVKDGEFAGWKHWSSDPFEQVAGPFYAQFDADPVVAAFRAQKHHLNGAGTVHGGCLMAFADFALFAIAQPGFDEGEAGVTLTFNSEFLDAAREGELIECTGEVTRAGRSIIFVRALMTADGRPNFSFSGTIKKIRRRPPPAE